MQIILVTLILLLVGCAQHSQKPELPSPPVIQTTREINLADYATPFGHSPDQADLENVFLSLPDQLAGDMPVDIRKGFISQSESDTTNHMFDRSHRYTTFYNDNPYNPYQASSIFIIKILPSSKYRYVVAIHLVKPCALNIPPSQSNTFFLAPKDSQWTDITKEILPESVSRDWYFQPDRSSNIIEVGPYQRNSSGYWTQGKRVYDLVWNDDHFRIKQPSSHDFTF